LTIWEYVWPKGGFRAKWFKNDVEFNPTEIDALDYVYTYSFIFPISLVEDNTTMEYFSYHADLLFSINVPHLDILTKQGSRYYEVIFEYSDGTYIMEYYRKYDKNSQYRYLTQKQRKFEVFET